MGRAEDGFVFTWVMIEDLAVSVWLHTADDPAPGAWQEACRDVAKVVRERGVERIRIFVVSDGGAPSTRQRREFFAEALRGHPTKIAVLTTVIDNPLKRGIATSLAWFNPQFRFYGVEDAQAAIRHTDIPLERFGAVWLALTSAQQVLHTRALVLVARVLGRTLIDDAPRLRSAP